MLLSDIKKVHFIGIGGIGMSALARLFLSEKKMVSGSDRSPSDITRTLEKDGIHFFPHQNGMSLSKDIDFVVYTEAMAKDHIEIRRAQELGIPMMNYFDALGMVANEYYLIAVAGSHGKTTTTAMLIDVFEEAGLDPSAIVGSLRSKTKSNYRAGKSKYFIVEACEYKRDFLSLTPDVLVITNIEHEHVDYYKSLRDVQDAFTEFAGKVREGGVVMVNFGGQNIAPVLGGIRATVIDYGKYFDPTLRLTMPGVHNQMNAAVALATAEFVGINRDVAKTALQHFTGTWRRFEYKGKVNDAPVYDDYGHHPTEIEATIRGARELYPDKKLILVFQSHTYSRTHALFDGFVRALSLADSVIVLPIYAAREENVSGVTHTMLVDALVKEGKSAHAYDTFGKVVTHIKKIADAHNMILVMGAGDITEVATKLVV